MNAGMALLTESFEDVGQHRQGKKGDTLGGGGWGGSRQNALKAAASYHNGNQILREKCWWY